MNTEDIQSHHYLLTINNPVSHGFDRDTIIKSIACLTPAYVCISDEIGEKGTPHTHIYIWRDKQMPYNLIRELLPPANIRICSGDNKNPRDYVLKQGRWKDTAKAKTTVPGSLFEYGTLPNGREARC